MEQVADSVAFFDVIAENYDSMNVKQWDAGAHSWQMDHIKNQLSLTSEDVVLDIGAGTGKDLACLRELARSTLPWVAMDPSQKMCDIASNHPGLIVQKALAQDAVTVLQSVNPQHPPNKVLIKHCVHHFIDILPKLARDLLSILPSGGSVLICAQEHRCGLPFFTKAIQTYLVSIRGPQFYSDIFKEAGFKVSVNSVYYETKVTRKSWNHFLRNRGYSTLKGLTDEEIEEGIKELDLQYGLEADLPILDDETFVLATKP